MFHSITIKVIVKKIIVLLIVLYGNVKIDKSTNKFTRVSKLKLPFIPGETIRDCIKRLELEVEEIGEVFINHCLSYRDEIIPHDHSRIGIFPRIMQLLDGGLYIRYCGYNTS